MSEFPHLPLFTDAFISDTGHLSAQETGAYLMLLMIAWRTPDCRLPDDDDRLARWARVDRRTWLRIKGTVMEFWTLADGCWTQRRLLKERDSVRKRADAARENGKHGGRPKILKTQETQNPTGSSWGTQEKASIPIPIHRKKDSVLDKESKTAADDDFELKPDDGEFRSPTDKDGLILSAEDEFWSLAETAAKKGITRSRLGQLAKLHGGDYDAALVGLKQSFRAKTPAAYLGKLISNLRAESEPAPVRAKRPKEPEFVREFREEGYNVQRLESGNYRIGGEIYDPGGQVIGW